MPYHPSRASHPPHVCLLNFVVALFRFSAFYVFFEDGISKLLRHSVMPVKFRFVSKAYLGENNLLIIK